eukprot:CAMPEP_0184709432 /NCGR_PEP_ID=MMETSP0314-20130426/583_1 /TAXON_ID=38298 /ORGANISM="Rhodella maculata, Strain CCMP 736" /LENGTH=85 /DNA_ID=CAMNT_0027171137 /DNA_START=90 /DNA_END=344 /DNA_ORIENTATION=-
MKDRRSKTPLQLATLSNRSELSTRDFLALARASTAISCPIHAGLTKPGNPGIKHVRFVNTPVLHTITPREREERSGDEEGGMRGH